MKYSEEDWLENMRPNTAKLNADVMGAPSSKQTPIQQIQQSVQVSEAEYYLRIDGKIRSLKNSQRILKKKVRKGNRFIYIPFIMPSELAIEYKDNAKKVVKDQWGNRGFIKNVFFTFKSYYINNAHWVDDPALPEMLYDVVKGIVIKDDDPLKPNGNGSTLGHTATQHLSDTGKAYVEIFMEVRQ